MKQTIFSEMVKKGSRTKKWLYFPLSLLFHLLILAAVIALPLMSTADNLPRVIYTTVAFVPPSPPPIPVNRGGGGGRKKQPEKKPKKDSPKPSIKQNTPVFIAEIPEDIEDETLDNFAAGFGDGPYIDGAPDGIPDGVPGAQSFFRPENIENQAPINITNIQQPRLIKRIEPIYPRTALLAHIQGIVVIEAVTDIAGNVVKTNVISGHPLLKQSAVQAVMQWIYEPYIFNGIPKPVIFTVRVNFRLQK